LSVVPLELKLLLTTDNGQLTTDKFKNKEESTKY